VYIFQQQSAAWPTPRVKIGYSSDVAARLLHFNYEARQHGANTWQLAQATAVQHRSVSTPVEGGTHAVKDATELAVMRYAISLGPERVVDQGGETYLVRDAETLQQIRDFAAQYKDSAPDVTSSKARAASGAGFRCIDSHHPKPTEHGRRLSKQQVSGARRVRETDDVVEALVDDYHQRICSHCRTQYRTEPPKRRVHQ